MFRLGFGMRRGFGVLITLLAILPSTLAQAPAASTFYFSDTETQFSLNIANDSSDVSIYFTSPAYSWVGVGFGAGMKDSLMFVLYPSQDGKNVTISPRIATGHSEPSYAKDIQIEALPGTTVTDDDMFIVKAVCRNCRVWANGFLDVKNTAQPMIFAFGPGNRLQSNSLDAPLKRHVRYGKFTMNMVAATGKGEVPGPNAGLSGVAILSITKDHDRMNIAHAIMGCIALFVLWPLNVIFAGFVKKIGIHVGISVLIIVFLVAAYALGIATSGEYNRSKAFNSPHQILAFISLLPLLAMSLLPLPRISALHASIPRLHIPLVSATLTILVLTGGLGLHLGSQSMPIILAYTAVALAVFCFVMLLQTCIKRRGSAFARQNGTSARRLEDDEEDLVMKAWKIGQGQSQSQSQQSFGNQSQVLAQGQQQHQGHGRGNSGGNIYGGGTMPGPQYMLNMHPGVPVHRW